MGVNSVFLALLFRLIHLVTAMNRSSVNGFDIGTMDIYWATDKTVI